MPWCYLRAQFCTALLGEEWNNGIGIGIGIAILLGIGIGIGIEKLGPQSIGIGIGIDR